MSDDDLHQRISIHWIDQFSSIILGIKIAQKYMLLLC